MPPPLFESHSYGCVGELASRGLSSNEFVVMNDALTRYVSGIAMAKWVSLAFHIAGMHPIGRR